MDETEIMSKQKHLSYSQLMKMEKQERIHFVNSLGGFKSVALIGSQSKDNQTNLAIVSSILHIGSSPPLFGMIFRPGVVERHTMENILETTYYTINHINESIYKKAHQTAARYERSISEFEETNLIPEYKNNFWAPFVSESKIQLAMEFKQKIEIPINNTILIIGEIKSVYFPEKSLSRDGFLDIESAGTITCSGLDSYHKTLKINRLSYAKPNVEITSIL